MVRKISLLIWNFSLFIQILFTYGTDNIPRFINDDGNTFQMRDLTIQRNKGEKGCELINKQGESFIVDLCFFAQYNYTLVSLQNITIRDGNFNNTKKIYFLFDSVSQIQISDIMIRDNIINDAKLIQISMKPTLEQTNQNTVQRITIRENDCRKANYDLSDISSLLFLENINIDVIEIIGNSFCYGSVVRLKIELFSNYKISNSLLISNQQFCDRFSSSFFLNIESEQKYKNTDKMAVLGNSKDTDFTFSIDYFNFINNRVENVDTIQQYEGNYDFYLMQIFDFMYVNITNVNFGYNQNTGGIQIMSSLGISLKNLELQNIEDSSNKDRILVNYNSGPLISILDTFIGELSNLNFSNSYFINTPSVEVISEYCLITISNSSFSNLRLNQYIVDQQVAPLTFKCELYDSNRITLNNVNITDIVINVIDPDDQKFASGILAKLKEGDLIIENCNFINPGTTKLLNYYNFAGFLRAKAQNIIVRNSTFENFINQTTVLKSGFIDVIATFVEITNSKFQYIKVQEAAVLYWSNLQSSYISLILTNNQFGYLMANMNGGVLYQQGSYQMLNLTIKDNNFTSIFCGDSSIQSTECTIMSIQHHDNGVLTSKINIENTNLENIFANRFIELLNHDTIVLNTNYTIKPFDKSTEIFLSGNLKELYISPLISSKNGKLVVKNFYFFRGTNDDRFSQRVLQSDCTSPFFLESKNDDQLTIQNIDIKNLRLCDKGFLIINSLSPIIASLRYLHFEEITLVNRLSQISSIFQFINLQKNLLQYTISVENCNFTRVNTSNTNYGLFYVYNFTFIFSHCYFKSNQAENGVVVFVDTPVGENLINSCNFISNNARQSGGIFQMVSYEGQENQGYKVIVIDSEFINNHAQENGGIIEFLRPQTRISSNSNEKPGSRDTTIFIFQKNRFSSNSAERGLFYFKGVSPIFDDQNRGINSQFIYNYPTQIILTEISDSHDESIKVERDGDAKITIQYLGSGYRAPKLSFRLIDDYNNTYIPETPQEEQFNYEFSHNLTNSSSTSSENSNNIYNLSLSYVKSGDFDLEKYQVIIPGPAVSHLYISHPSLRVIDHKMGAVQNSYFRFEIQVFHRACEKGEYEKQINQSTALFTCEPCPHGQFSNDRLKCYDCPEGGICYGGSQFGKNYIDVSPGYWRAEGSNEADIRYCEHHSFNLGNCIGGDGYGNSLCKRGYVGAECLACDIMKINNNESWTQMFGGECTACSLDYQTILTLIFSVLWIWLTLYFSLTKSKKRVEGISRLSNVSGYSLDESLSENHVFIDLSVCFKLITMYFVYISAIFYLEIPLPFYTNLLAFFIDPLLLSSSSFDCFLVELWPQSNFIYLNLRFSIVFPLVISLTYNLLYVAIVQIRKEKIKQEIFIKAAIFQFLYMQPRMVQFMFAILSCKKIGDKQFIYIDTTLECYSDEHQQYIFQLIIPMLIIICVIIPLWFLAILKKKSDHLQCHDCLRKYSVLFFQYKDNHKYWEIVKIYFRTAFSIALSLIADDIILRGLTVFSILITYYFIVQFSRPMRTNQLNELDQRGTLCACVSILIALVIKQKESNHQENNPITIIGYILIILINGWYISQVFKMAKQYNGIYLKDMFRSAWYRIRGKKFEPQTQSSIIGQSMVYNPLITLNTSSDESPDSAKELNLKDFKDSEFWLQTVRIKITFFIIMTIIFTQKTTEFNDYSEKPLSQIQKQNNKSSQ